MTKFRILLVLLALLAIPLSTLFLQTPGPADPTMPPALLNASQYYTHTTGREVKAPRLQVKKWLERRRLVSFMEPTEGLPSVVSTTPISGKWGENGALRYANLDDGNTAIDLIIENRDPDLFHYQVFGFTAPSRFVINHIQGRLEYSQNSDGVTTINWTYAIAPNGLLTGPVAGYVLRNTIMPFMEATMDRMTTAANAELSGKTQADD
ncbi:MAG: hypothetical protein AAFO98_04000 [Pseudomonadota bacterium]